MSDACEKKQYPEMVLVYLYSCPWLCNKLCLLKGKEIHITGKYFFILGHLSKDISFRDLAWFTLVCHNLEIRKPLLSNSLSQTACPGRPPMLKIINPVGFTTKIPSSTALAMSPKPNWSSTKPYTIAHYTLSPKAQPERELHSFTHQSFRDSRVHTN